MLIMENRNQIAENDTIFTTGAHLRAFEVEINGKKQWRWIVVGQEDDAYHDDDDVIDVYDYADTFDGLFISTED